MGARFGSLDMANFVYIGTYTNDIVACKLEEETGLLTVLKTIPCGGEQPSFLCSSPDGKDCAFCRTFIPTALLLISVAM